jgi:hypothetical protein
MSAHLSDRCLLVLAGMCDEATRQEFEAIAPWRVHWLPLAVV